MRGELAALTPAEHLLAIFLFFNNFPIDTEKRKVIKTSQFHHLLGTENRLELGITEYSLSPKESPETPSETNGYILT